MTSSATFGARLRAAVDQRGPLCAGIDPHTSLLAEWGLPLTVEGLERFALTAVEALAPEVSVVKPQSAFFERFGSKGIAVLERVIADSRAAGALVLLDVKRGDIGSTAQAYADAYLDPHSPLASDAITASPYLGFGSVQPMIDTALANGAGVFVLALTSNKEGPQVQHASTASGRSVGGSMLDELRPAQRRCRAARLARRGGRRDDRQGRRVLRVQRSDPCARCRRAGRHRGRRTPHLRSRRPQRAAEHVPWCPRGRSRRGITARAGTPSRRRVRGAGEPVRAVLATALMLAVVATGCDKSEDDLRADYCDQVEADADQITRAVDEKGAAAFVDVLPMFEELADEAPGDVRDEWQVFLNALRGLRDALDETGVKPEEVDGKLPADLPAADRRRISLAASVLAGEDVKLATQSHRAARTGRVPHTAVVSSVAGFADCVAEPERL